MAEETLFGRIRGRAELLDQIYFREVDYTFPLELMTYYRLPEWHRADSVLDLGTGNGYYLHRLAREFPDKRYVGVDSSAEVVALARSRFAAANLAFSEADLFAWGQPADCLILRAVLQHLPDLAVLARHLAGLVRPGGAVVFVDADAENPPYFWPEAPAVRGMFAAVRQKQAKARGGGTAFAALRPHLPTAGFECILEDALKVPSSLAGNAERICEQVALVIELLRETGAIDYDLAAAQQEWEGWARQEPRYAELSVRRLVVRREASPEA